MIRKTLLGGVLLAAFLVLAAALLAIPTWAASESVTQTTLEDFNAGDLYRTGLTRNDDGEVQLLVIGLAGEWITDTNATGFLPRAGHTAVYVNGRIYVLGGWDDYGQARRDVFYTTVDTETHDLANWHTTEPLSSTVYPGGLFFHASVVFHDWLYVLGGENDDDGGTVFSTVSFAHINSNGTLGEWQVTEPLSMAVSTLDAVVVNDRIYVMGGLDEDENIRAEVYFATPNPANGQISEWTRTTDLEEPLYGHMAAVEQGRIYVLGGGVTSGDVSPLTYYATPNPGTGEIDGWINTTDMNNNVFGGKALSINGVLFTIGGGINNLTQPSRYVGAALVEPNGSIGSWSNTSLVYPPRLYHAAVSGPDGWLYVIGGTDGTGAIENINRGATSGLARQYAKEGTFTSLPFNLGGVRRLQALQWNTTISDTSSITVTMEYRTRNDAASPWSVWSGAFKSDYAPGTSGMVTTTIPLNTYARYLQYRATLKNTTEAITNTITPSLNAVRLIYEKPEYALHIRKDADPAPGTNLLPGDPITYTLTYSNGLNGITTTHTIIADNVPQYASFVPGSISGTGNYNSEAQQVLWDLGWLGPGQSGKVSFQVIVSPTLAHNATIHNEAFIDAAEGPPKYSETIIHQVLVACLDVVQDADPPPGSTVKPGTLITYTLDYDNCGYRDVSGVAIADVLPAEVTYVSNSIWPADQGDASNPELLTWSIGDLASGAQGSVRFQATVDSDVSDGITITNNFTIDSDQTGPQASPPVEHVVKLPISSISLTGSATPPHGSTVEPGQTISYTLDYVNDGESTLTELELMDPLPPYVTYVEGSIWPPDQGDGSNPDELVWRIDTLAPGATGSVHFSAQVDDVPGGLTIGNQFQADSSQTDPEQSNVVEHHTTRQAPDLVVTSIKAEPASPSAGSPFDLSVTVSNIGTVDADTTDFWVEVYIKPCPSTGPTGPSDHLLGYCTGQPCTPPYRDQYVKRLAFLNVGSPPFQLSFTNLVLPSGGDYDIYAQIDVSFYGDDPDWGRYLEENENNNTNRIVLGSGIVYLPFVSKH
jgi:uncharacterized repeat protein (TIGR01451 family)